MTRDRALQLLREHEADFKARGVTHLRLFGSVARNEATEASDVDVIVDFDPAMQLSLLDPSAVWGELHDLFEIDIDLVREKTLRPHLKSRVLQEAVLAF